MLFKSRFAYILLLFWLVFQLCSLSNIPFKILFLHAVMISGCVNVSFVLSICFQDDKTDAIPLFLLLLTGVFTVLYSIDVLLVLEYVRANQASFAH